MSTGDAMSPQEPTPTPDVRTPAELLAKILWDDLDMTTCAQDAIDALHAAGYELVNQVGTIGPVKRTVKNLSGSLMGDVLEQPPNLVELTARWIGERESTHLWPEIREDDKACYRDAARHLFATIKFGLADAAMSLDPAERERAGRALEAMAPRATAAAERMAKQERRLANTRQRASLAANNWLTRMLENTNTVCVQLPEPLPTAEWSYEGCAAMWPGREDDDGEYGTQVAAMDDGTVEIGMARYAPDVARLIAADVLAAAAKVEASE